MDMSISMLFGQRYSSFSKKNESARKTAFFFHCGAPNRAIVHQFIADLSFIPLLSFCEMMACGEAMT